MTLKPRAALCELCPPRSPQELDLARDRIKDAEEQNNTNRDEIGERKHFEFSQNSCQ